ncbi:GNAT family N-acetyltransferase [Phenylobacterium sp.]|jgi:GNAT superfamily N-acetyltransferase|uniref:GNAT family N-acetyltransferase n=1 Tax=Phenylobacterium sp. TaxID=1871053 RepID=UPI002F3E6831
MDNSGPRTIEVGFASHTDVGDIVATLLEGAAWMAAKHSPAWQVSDLTPAMATAFVSRSEFIAARAGGDLVGVCTLTRVDPDFWPEDPPGFAAYIHKLAVRRAFAGGQVTRSLVEHCLTLARAWGCKALRLDCHPVLNPVYRRLEFNYVDTRNVALADGRTLLVDRFEIRL